jgi:hypothetical protein
MGKAEVKVEALTFRLGCLGLWLVLLLLGLRCLVRLAIGLALLAAHSAIGLFSGGLFSLTFLLLFLGVAVIVGACIAILVGLARFLFPRRFPRPLPRLSRFFLPLRLLLLYL